MTPSYRITADQTDITPLLRGRLLALTITNAAGTDSDTLEITLDDTGGAIALPPRGAALDVALGFKGQLTQMGRYIVDELAGEIAPATLTIRAKAADMAGGIRAPKTRAWQDKTLGQIAGQIASENALEPVINRQLIALKYPYIAQTAESDLHLLTRLARESDAIVKIAEGRLIITPQTRTGAPAAVILVQHMQRASWQLPSRHAYACVTALWHDPDMATRQPITAGSGAPAQTLRHVYPDQDQARRAANAALTKAQRQGGTISADLAGFRGDLTAGAQVLLPDLKPPLAGAWQISSVTHQLSQTLFTSFEASRSSDNAS